MKPSIRAGLLSYVRWLFWLVWLLPTGCFGIAQQVRAEHPSASQLQQALRSRVTIHVHPRSGKRTATPHCRRAAEGCDARLSKFASYLTDAGDKYGLDPWLLAAMAYRESGLNPFAVGTHGEKGILQLHPKNRHAKDLRFIHDAGYRARCEHQAGACQRELVDRAAQVLASSLAKCGGDLERALGMYNTGRCGGSPPYARRVLKERAHLLALAEQETTSVPDPRSAELAAGR